MIAKIPSLLFSWHFLDIDECSNGTPCDNAGVCTNTPGTFTCDCTGTGFEGPTCSDRKFCMYAWTGSQKYPYFEDLTDVSARSTMKRNQKAFLGCSKKKNSFDPFLYTTYRQYIWQIFWTWMWEICVVKNIRATSWQNQQNDLCAQRRLRSAWASASLIKSSLCAQWVAMNLSFLHVDSEDSDQTDLNLRWAHMSFCWFCHEAAHTISRKWASFWYKQKAALLF